MALRVPPLLAGYNGHNLSHEQSWVMNSKRAVRSAEWRRCGGGCNICLPSLAHILTFGPSRKALLMDGLVRGYRNSCRYLCEYGLAGVVGPSRGALLMGWDGRAMAGSPKYTCGCGVYPLKARNVGCRSLGWHGVALKAPSWRGHARVLEWVSWSATDQLKMA